MNCLAGIHVHCIVVTDGKRGHPVNRSAGDYGSTASAVYPSLQEFTQQTLVFTEGSAVSGNDKMNE